VSDLERAVPRSDRSKGGRPAFDHVLMFKVLILQASYSLSDKQTGYLIRDRLSFMRFLGLALADAVPDANTIWTFREALTRAKLQSEPAIEFLFKRSYDMSLTRLVVTGRPCCSVTYASASLPRIQGGAARPPSLGRGS
jgi:transposase, IS5 family